MVPDYNPVNISKAVLLQGLVWDGFHDSTTHPLAVVSD
jgi:hypothetical protein